MAILSSDGKSVTVVKGDTLSAIALTYLGSASKYQQLAAINNISNPNLIYVGQVIKLTSSGSTATSSTTNSSVPTILQFGVQSTSDNTLFATWSWGKTNTASYKVMWYYDTGNGVWFIGNDSSITVDDNEPSASRQSTYNFPSDANRVKFKVKPISKTYTKNNKETSYWIASWSTEKIYNAKDLPPTAPPTPNVKIENFTLTTDLDNLNSLAVPATHIQFEIIRNNSIRSNISSLIEILHGYASYSYPVTAGSTFKVHCRTFNNNMYSDWSEYSNNYSTIPATPKGFTVYRANSETSVYLEWDADTTSDDITYDIEYTTEKRYFEGSNDTTTINDIDSTKYEITGLESGDEYFFRLRSSNSNGDSGWSEISSVVIGKKPSAPTTWSSTTTAIVGETINLYWVHNSEDGSSQTYAELELTIDGIKETRTIKNNRDEEDKDKTSSYSINTVTIYQVTESSGTYTKTNNILLVEPTDGTALSATTTTGETVYSYTDDSGITAYYCKNALYFSEGAKIQWRVRTAGITKTYGDWSVQRTIDVYAPPTLELSVTDSSSNILDMIESFPFYVYGLPGPNTQAPIGYQLTISSNESYEATDYIGNTKIVNVGEEIYSKYFDISDALLVEFSANNINLENNISYTVTCVVSMNSGLTAESSSIFTVSWTDMQYEPNAEISIDSESFTATIRPYCEETVLTRYKVTENSGTYTISTEVIDSVYGEIIDGATTTTGEKVYYGMTDSGEEVYYCEIESSTLVENVSLSVYRREFDGSFTEIATGLDNTVNTSITDPHPALDYARYRIVAITTTTGAVSYYDLPGYPVRGIAVIIQWDEEWTSFDTSNQDLLEQPPWTGSLLKLPYNIDISDSHSSDVALVEYIGRSHPITYYGTQLGETSTWNVEIDKSDEETLYALRRLAKWMGDVYVREPSGSGYWANASVSISQKHCEVTIPVTLNITRVEGGV